MNPTRFPTDSVPQLVGELYSLVDKFETLFGRRFTPDGHLVGSIGEVVAAHRYGLELLPQSSRGHDARTSDGLLVEIKVTQRGIVALREEPVHLLVLHLSRRGEVTEIYNGPGAPAWTAARPMQRRNGQRAISLAKLRKLSLQVRDSDRLPILRDKATAGDEKV